MTYYEKEILFAALVKMTIISIGAVAFGLWHDSVPAGVFALILLHILIWGK